mmetsp:Transcript_10241/g.17627  ORF Transcript_10241/g.17627 Transcript_10241/m.17627 type:complete len:515 (-) Transcript_10241:180-1724(-)
MLQLKEGGKAPSFFQTTIIDCPNKPPEYSLMACLTTTLAGAPSTPGGAPLRPASSFWHNHPPGPGHGPRHALRPRPPLENCPFSPKAARLALRYLLQLGEHLPGGGDRGVDVLLRVLQRGEARLVLGGRQVDPALEHGPVPAAELGRVGLGRVREAVHGALREEEAEHARDGAAADGVAVLEARGQDAVDQLLGDRVQVLVGPRALEDLQGLQAGGHGQGVAREGASLVHGAGRGHHLHDVLAAAVGADGEAAADDLAHGGHVGGDAEVALRAAVRDAEAGHHLVEDQQRAVLGGQLAQALQELLGGGDEARVAHHGLQDDGRHLVLLQQGLHALQVLVGGDQGAGGGALGHAGGVGQAEGGHARAGLHEEAIGVAVVAPVELDDLLAAGEGAHQAEHAHAGLGTRVSETDHLHGGDGINHGLGELILQGRGSTERGTLIKSDLESIQNLVVGMAADSRSPGSNVVDVFVAIHVVGVGTLHAIEDHGVAADRFESADRRRDSTRHKTLCFLKDL